MAEAVQRQAVPQDPRIDASAAGDPSLQDIGLGNYAPYLLNRIMGRYNASLRDEMAQLGLTTPKMRALAVLSVIDAPLVRELAVYAVVEQSTLSRALDGLAADGLIARSADTADSRGVRISLTPAGRTAFARLWPHMAQAQARMFRGIGAAEREAFVSTLQTMLANIRKHPI